MNKTASKNLKKVLLEIEERNKLIEGSKSSRKYEKREGMEDKMGGVDQGYVEDCEEFVAIKLDVFVTSTLIKNGFMEDIGDGGSVIPVLNKKTGKIILQRLESSDCITNKGYGVNYEDIEYVYKMKKGQKPLKTETKSKKIFNKK